MKVNSQIGAFSIVPEWVLMRGLSPTALKLYVVLARFADWQTGRAFPSRETLADRMGCSEKTIDRAVKELEREDCVESWVPKRYASKQYRVFQVDPRGDSVAFDGTGFSDEWTNMSDDETSMSGDGTNLSAREDTDVHLTITNERKPIQRELNNEPFELFWSVYPRRVGKTAALKAFDKAVKTVGLDTVLQGVQRLADDPNLPDKQYIPHPATWLNEGRWDDEPYPAKTWDVKPTAAQRTASLIHNARERDERDLITKGIGSGPDFGASLKEVY
jgi:hypothetical protein